MAVGSSTYKSVVVTFCADYATGHLFSPPHRPIPHASHALPSMCSYMYSPLYNIPINSFYLNNTNRYLLI